MSSPEDNHESASIIDCRPIPGVRAICGNVKPLSRTVASMFGLAALFLLVVFMTVHTSGAKTWAAGIGIAAAACLGIALILLFYQPLAFRRKHAHRRARLEKLRQTPGAFTRLPHRGVELQVLCDQMSGKFDDPWYCFVPPGPAIVVGLRPSATWLSDPTPIGGEPVHLQDDLRLITSEWLRRGGRLAANVLANEKICDAALAAESVRVQQMDDAFVAAQRQRRNALRMQRIALALLVLWLAYWAWAARSTTFAFSALISTIVGFVVARATIGAKKAACWVAPGALIHPPQPARGRTIATVFTPANARLIVASLPLGGGTTVIANGKAVKLAGEFPGMTTQLPLVLYWASASGACDLERVRAFLGDDVKIGPN